MKNILLIILTFFSINAFSYQYSKEIINVQNGLSQNDARAVFQDSRGFIWVATNNGLNKYDGYSFEKYKIGYNGLKTNLILNIAEDKLGNLWINTADDGIYLFLYDKNKMLRLADNPNSKMLSFRSSFLFIDSLGYIWSFSNQEKKIIRLTYNYSNDTISDIVDYNLGENGLLAESVRKIQEIDNKLFFLTNKGVFTFNRNYSSFELFCGKRMIVNNFEKINNNKFILVGYSGIYLYFTRKSKIKKIYSFIENSKIIIKNNTFYAVNSTDLKLLHFNRAKEYIDKVKVIDKYQNFKNRSLFVDREDNIWVGFARAGIYKYFKRENVFDIENDFGNNHIVSLCVDKNNSLWVGTDGSGLFKIQDNKISHVVEGGFIPFITKQDDNILYSGPDKTFNIININTGKQEKILFDNKNIRYLLDDNYYYWYCTYDFGLYRYNKQTKKTVNFNVKNGLHSNIVRSIMKDKKNNIWLTTEKGVAVIPSKIRYNSVENITVTNVLSLKDYYYISMCQAYDQSIWFGSIANGVAHAVDIDSSFNCKVRFYCVKNGLVSNMIKTVIEDNEKNIWISTNKGINTIRGKKISFFSLEDGLQDLEFSELCACKDKDGKLYFGGACGVNSIQPETIKMDTTRNKTVLTDFLLFNNSIIKTPLFKEISDKPIYKTKNLKLNYDQNSFTFVFSALLFNNQRRNRFLYRLKGFDKQWSKTYNTEHKATYTNLDYGKYVFQVKSTNRDGLWGKNQTNINITIEPPYWKTPYAYIFYILVLGLILLMTLNYFKYKKKRAKEILLANFEKEKSQELLKRETLFFTNISHELRTPLTLLISPIQKMVDEGLLNNDKFWSKTIKIMYNNGKMMRRLINELMDFSRLESGSLKVNLQKFDLVNLVNGISSQFEYSLQQNDIEFRKDLPEKGINVYLDSYFIEQILYNLISNAIKFTPPKGIITIGITKEEDKVSLYVKDSGKGISKEMQKYIFDRYYSVSSVKDVNSGKEDFKANSSTGIGLYLTKKLVALQDGSIDVKSEENQGAIFTVSFPFFKSFDSFKNLENPILPLENIDNGDVKNSSYIEYTPHKNKTLLIVDDNREICSFLGSLFEQILTIKYAYDGQEAWEIIEKSIPDIIISDVMMPNMNGFELCDKLKRDKRTSHIPIVLLTAKKTEADILKGYSIKADAYCSKPFNNKILVGNVISLLENRMTAEERFNKYNILPKNKEVSSKMVFTSADETFFKKMTDIINENISNPDFSVKKLCDEMGVSPFIMNKKLKTVFNTTSNGYIRNIRMKKALQLLNSGLYTVAEVTYEVGYSDLRHFRECFKKEFGVLPQNYKSIK